MPLRAFTFFLAMSCWLSGQEAAPEIGAPAKSAEDQVVVDVPTEQTIQGALRWLAAQQQANGSWGVAPARKNEHPVAMTGYVLMAFLASGNLPEEGEYAKQVKAGMEFLLDQIGVDGQFRGVDGSKYMYNHGIATIALAEIYGQTRHPAMREKLRRAIQLIITSQSENGRFRGGWRYQPRPGDADISVTVLQVVALRAAKNAGLDVPQQTIDWAVDYVRRCAVGTTGGFRYQAGGFPMPGFARTAAAVYSLQVCGEYEDPLVEAGSKYMFENRFEKKYRTYGAYYAGPAQYMIGGDHWRKWYDYMKQLLLPSTERRGEQCYWEDNEVGAIFATACYTTILAIPWHYVPLYQR